MCEDLEYRSMRKRLYKVSMWTEIQNMIDIFEYYWTQILV